MSAANDHYVRLLHRMNVGDQQAASEFVRHFSPILRRVITVYLEGYVALRRICDVGDVEQDIWVAWLRSRSRRELPDDLSNDARLTVYLKQFARYKAAKVVRFHFATAKRDLRCQRSFDVMGWLWSLV